MTGTRLSLEGTMPLSISVRGTGGVCTGVHSIALARNEVSSFGVDRDRTRLLKAMVAARSDRNVD